MGSLNMEEVFQCFLAYFAKKQMLQMLQKQSYGRNLKEQSYQDCMKYTYKHKMKSSFFSCSPSCLNVSLLVYSLEFFYCFGAKMEVEDPWNIMVSK